MQANERIRIEAVTKTPSAMNPSGVTVASSVTRWADAITMTAADALARYGVELDAQVVYEFRFFDTPTITLRNSQFVWMSSGHDNYLKRYRIVGNPLQLDGVGRVTSVLVEETGS